MSPSKLVLGSITFGPQLPSKSTEIKIKNQKKLFWLIWGVHFSLLLDVQGKLSVFNLLLPTGHPKLWLLCRIFMRQDHGPIMSTASWTRAPNNPCKMCMCYFTMYAQEWDIKIRACMDLEHLPIWLWTLITHACRTGIESIPLGFSSRWNFLHLVVKVKFRRRRFWCSGRNSLGCRWRGLMFFLEVDGDSHAAKNI